jgi:hypothetical protein
MLSRSKGLSVAVFGGFGFTNTGKSQELLRCKKYNIACLLFSPSLITGKRDSDLRVLNAN